MVKRAVFCYIDPPMTTPATLPLSHYQLFQTGDVDEARECVARIFCPHGLHVAHPGTALDARHHSVRLHQDVSLNYVQYGPAVRIDPGYLGDFYLLQIPLRGGAEIRCGRQQVLADTYLLTSLLTLAPHNHSACLQPGARRSLLPRSVRRAQEYLHEHVTAPLSLADLCQHLGVSARALQQAFRQHLGRSPMAYWRDLRLDHVHAVLARSGPDDKASVSQVAAQYGFLHLGHFAAQYQARFGELPTQTLRTGTVGTH